LIWVVEVRLDDTDLLDAQKMRARNGGFEQRLPIGPKMLWGFGDVLGHGPQIGRCCAQVCEGPASALVDIECLDEGPEAGHLLLDPVLERLGQGVI